MQTLGQLKSFFSQAVVNQALLSGTQINDWVYWVATDIVTTAPFWWNRGRPRTFATVDGTAEYFLSSRVMLDNVWGMYDQTSDQPLHKRDIEWMYAQDPTPTDEGDPSYWAYVGHHEAQAIDATGGAVTAVSSNALDTDIDVVCRGPASSIEDYDILTLNGTTSVSGSKSTSFDANAVVEINLESAAQGIVTVTGGSGSTTLASIPPGETRVQCPLIRLFLVPGDANTIQYHFYKTQKRPVSDSEMIDLPEIAYKALHYGIEEIAHFYNGKQQASLNAFEKYREAKRELVSLSERDIAGNEIKDYKETGPFHLRLPETIDGSVTE